MAGLIAELEVSIPALRRFANALVRDPSEADRLVRDCLVSALDSLPSRRAETDPRVWLFSIVHNLAGRRAGRPRPRGDADSGVLAALGELPLDQRSMLVLVAVEDLSYADAAQVVGVPVDAAMALLASARETLRRAEADPAPATLRRVK